MELTVPGDKSISHRALLLAALAEGESRLSGLLAGADARSTRTVLGALGAPLPPLPPDGAEIRVRGVGLRGLTSPAGPLDCGNSGTTARLLLGVLAGQHGLEAVLTGDASLRRRPMRRVTRPLALMGTRFEELGEAGRLPVRVTGGALQALEHESPVASAQVKSALLLAGLVGGVFVLVREPSRSRDHTERMLARVGAPLISHPFGGGWSVELRDPPEQIRPLELHVPGDFSSAAFLLVLALLGGTGDGLVLRDVGLNPTRTGLLGVLERMGARIDVRGGPVPAQGAPADALEPRGDLAASPGPLHGVDVGGEDLATFLDEVPVLAVAAARADGVTRITGAAELRVKESDRLRALAENLRAVGVEAEELADGLEVRGTDRPLRGRVRALHDHRIAMAFGVLGALPGNHIDVDDPGVADVSYPGFWELLARLGPRADGAPSRARLREGPVVTVDGPAGSGKSSTARELARRLGFRHLDSGALYRALTFALMEQGPPPERWPDLTERDLEALGLGVEARADGFRILLRGRELEAELRGPAVNEHVSELARLPVVRRWLLATQREAGRSGRLVADGRDMGTVVFPDADLKVFLVADLEERTRRRLSQEGVEDPGADRVRQEADRIAARDRRDSEREASPLREPEGAFVLDTTGLTFEQQVEAIAERVRALTPP